MPIPIIVEDSSSVASGTSLTTLRNRLAETLGHHGVGTITTAAASLEADKYLISTAYQSDQLPPDHLDGLFAYIRDGAEAGESRRLVSGAFDGPIGAVVADQPFGSGALPGGTVFEISVLPGNKYQGAEGLNHIIFLALEQLPVIDYVPITVTSEAGGIVTNYSLGDYPWPIKRVEAVIYPRTSTTLEPRREMPRCWDFDQDGELPVLSFTSLPANTGDVIEVKLLRPAHTWIQSGGSWGDSTVGLVEENDECLYDPLTVVEVARPIALERMALLAERGSKLWSSLKSEAAAEEIDGRLARFYSRFKGSGAQKAGAR